MTGFLSNYSLWLHYCRDLSVISEIDSYQMITINLVDLHVVTGIKVDLKLKLTGMNFNPLVYPVNHK